MLIAYSTQAILRKMKSKQRKAYRKYTTISSIKFLMLPEKYKQRTYKKAVSNLQIHCI